MYDDFESVKWDYKDGDNNCERSKCIEIRQAFTKEDHAEEIAVGLLGYLCKIRLLRLGSVVDGVELNAP